jgi:hypothetical protein
LTKCDRGFCTLAGTQLSDSAAGTGKDGRPTVGKPLQLKLFGGQFVAVDENQTSRVERHRPPPPGATRTAAPVQPHPPKGPQTPVSEPPARKAPDRKASSAPRSNHRNPVVPGMAEFWGNGRPVSLRSRSSQAHKENRSRNGLPPGRCRRAFNVTLCVSGDQAFPRWADRGSKTMDHERLAMRRCGALRPVDGPGELLRPGHQHAARKPHGAI